MGRGSLMDVCVADNMCDDVCQLPKRYMYSTGCISEWDMGNLYLDLVRGRSVDSK